MSWHRFALVLLLMSGTCSAAEFRSEIREVLEGAVEIELLSIVPSSVPERHDARSPGNFNGWRVLGRTTVKGKQGRDLVSAFKESLWEEGGMSPACFNPRHGIRARLGGKTVDLLICFECVKTKVFVDGIDDRRYLPHGRAPESGFDAVLKAANVPLARDHGPGRQ
jgi:hypothetical protein